MEFSLFYILFYNLERSKFFFDIFYGSCYLYSGFFFSHYFDSFHHLKKKFTDEATFTFTGQKTICRHMKIHTLQKRINSNRKFPLMFYWLLLETITAVSNSEWRRTPQFSGNPYERIIVRYYSVKHST